MSDSPVRLLIVDDQVLVRQGLRRLLEIEPGVEVVADAADGIEALEVLTGVTVDVVLVDARMPRMDGITLVGELSRRHPDVPAIILTTFDDYSYIVDGLRAGARGYLLKDTPPDELVTALRRVARGETVLGDQAAAFLVRRLRSDRPLTGPGRVDGDGDGLSEREREVAALIAEGAANREIARRLYITEGTAKNHVSAIMRKLGAPDRTALALRLARSPGSPGRSGS